VRRYVTLAVPCGPAAFPGSRAVGVVLGHQITTRGLHEPASPLGFRPGGRRVWLEATPNL